MKKNFIPTIDISALLKNLNSNKSKQTIKKIEKACLEVGFFQIINHGINIKQIQSISPLYYSQRLFNDTLQH